MDKIHREYLRGLLEVTIDEYEETLGYLRTYQSKGWPASRSMIADHEIEKEVFENLLKELNETGELKYEGKQ